MGRPEVGRGPRGEGGGLGGAVLQKGPRPPAGRRKVPGFPSASLGPDRPGAREMPAAPKTQAAAAREKRERSRSDREGTGLADRSKPAVPGRAAGCLEAEQRSRPALKSSRVSASLERLPERRFPVRSCALPGRSASGTGTFQVSSMEKNAVPKLCCAKSVCCSCRFLMEQQPIQAA